MYDQSLKSQSDPLTFSISIFWLWLRVLQGLFGNLMKVQLELSELWIRIDTFIVLTYFPFVPENGRVMCRELAMVHFGLSHPYNSWRLTRTVSKSGNGQTGSL